MADAARHLVTGPALAAVGYGMQGSLVKEMKKNAIESGLSIDELVQDRDYRTIEAPGQTRYLENGVYTRYAVDKAIAGYSGSFLMILGTAMFCCGTIRAARSYRAVVRRFKSAVASAKQTFK